LAPTSLQGLQNQMFAIFMLLIIFPNLVQLMMPYFVTQRALYEVRERPSKAYSWKAFMLASIVVEIPWNVLMALPAYFGWYYPIGLFRNGYPTNSVTERGGTMFLLILIFMLFASTFSSMVIAGIEQAETGGNIAQLLFSLCLIFNGYVNQSGWSPQLTDPLQRPRDPRRSPRLLDLHVPRVAIYLPRLGHVNHRRGQCRRQMHRHRASAPRSSAEPDMLRVPGTLRENGECRAAQPRSDVRLQPLPDKHDGSVSEAAEHGIRQPVSKRRPALRVRGFQHICGVVSVLVDSDAEEVAAEGEEGVDWMVLCIVILFMYSSHNPVKISV
jgi:hypothetical protein